MTVKHMPEALQIFQYVSTMRALSNRQRISTDLRRSSQRKMVLYFSPLDNADPVAGHVILLFGPTWNNYSHEGDSRDDESHVMPPHVLRGDPNQQQDWERSHEK